MRFEDLTLRAALLASHHTLQFLDLLARHCQRRMQPRHLALHHPRRNAIRIRLIKLILQHMHHGMCHPR